MKIDRFNEIVKEETGRIEDILVKKQAEYNLDEDRLSHFKHAAAMANWPIEKVLYGYMLKHLMSVTDMVNSGKKFSKALWQEKMTDIHNYLILLLAVLEDADMFSGMNEEKKAKRSDKKASEPKISIIETADAQPYSYQVDLDKLNFDSISTITPEVKDRIDKVLDERLKTLLGETPQSKPGQNKAGTGATRTNKAK